MLGALLSAGTSILGGILGNKSQEKANKKNEQLQREFAQNAIQYKVADAQKAGIHPLYALGANTVSFSPSNVGSTALSEGIAQAGQGIGRAIDSGRSAGERLSARASELAITRGELENQKLATEIALMQQAGTPPPPLTENAIIPGQGVVETKPSNTTTTMVGMPYAEAGTPPEVQYYKTGDGGVAPLPSKQASEPIESNFAASMGYALRNNVLPSLGVASKPPPESMLPSGATHWKFDPFRQAYYPVHPKR